MMMVCDHEYDDDNDNDIQVSCVFICVTVLKKGADFVTCVVFNISCIANFPSANTEDRDFSCCASHFEGITDSTKV